MSDKIYHIRIKKKYAAVIIEFLIKAGAIEVIAQGEPIKLTGRQKGAIDKALAAITADPNCLQRWDDIEKWFKIPCG